MVAKLSHASLWMATCEVFQRRACEANLPRVSDSRERGALWKHFFTQCHGGVVSVSMATLFGCRCDGVKKLGSSWHEILNHELCLRESGRSLLNCKSGRYCKRTKIRVRASVMSFVITTSAEKELYDAY